MNDKAIFDTEHLSPTYFRLALPVVFSMVITLIYNLADTYFIARTNDARLVAGDDRPFAVLVCDVNGLKEINDELGHTAGNEYLKTACRLICTVFKHSPVYRIGGDEFAAILEGKDYENWERLAVDLAEQDKTDPETGQAVIAYGISALRPGEDAVFRQVFARADRAMYQNKKQGKEGRG